MAQTDEAAAPAEGGQPAARRFWRASWRVGTWRRGWVLALLAVLTAGLLAFHSWVPNAIGNLGSLLETFLPWLGLAVPVLLVLALLRRSALALVAVLLPAVVWLNLFGGLLTTRAAARATSRCSPTTSPRRTPTRPARCGC